MLDLLAQSERSVEALAREAGLSVASTSQHLQALRSARLVETEKRGTFVVYRLADPLVLGFVRAIRDLAEQRLTEIRQLVRDYLESREGMDPGRTGSTLPSRPTADGSDSRRRQRPGYPGASM